MLTRLRATIIGTASAVAVAAGYRLADAGWRAVRHRPPPTADDAVDDAGFRDLLVWAGVLTGSVYVARRAVLAVLQRTVGEDA